MVHGHGKFHSIQCAIQCIEQIHFMGLAFGFYPVSDHHAGTDRYKTEPAPRPWPTFSARQKVGRIDHIAFQAN